MYIELTMSAAHTLPADPVLEPMTREFWIVLAKRDALVAELARLAKRAKRAKRIGAPAIAWTFGAVENRPVEVRIVDDSESEGGVLPNTVMRLVPFQGPVEAVRAGYGDAALAGGDSWLRSNRS